MNGTTRQRNPAATTPAPSAVLAGEIRPRSRSPASPPVRGADIRATVNGIPGGSTDFIFASRTRRHLAASIDNEATSPEISPRPTAPVKYIVVSLASRATGRLHEHAAAASSPRSPPRPGATSALVTGVHVPAATRARGVALRDAVAGTTTRRQPAPPARPTLSALARKVPPRRRTSRRHRPRRRRAARQGRPGRLSSTPGVTSSAARSSRSVYRIGPDRSNNAVGVFLYCQQHAREWTTSSAASRPPTGSRATTRSTRDARSYSTTRGVHPAERQPGRRPLLLYDFSSQRKNMTN